MKYTYEDILEKMKFDYRNNAFTEVGKYSTEDMILKTLASELFSLSCYGDYIIKQSFVQTATGEHLDRLGAIRKCNRKKGGKATGKISFCVAEVFDHDIIIEKGTVCSVGDDPLLQFETIDETCLFAGCGEVTVYARALDYGTKYNVKPWQINVMVNAPVSITGVVNYEAFTGGYDGESDESYRQRLLDVFEVPSYYMCSDEIRNRILQVENVIDCSVAGVRTPGELSVVVRMLNDADFTNEYDKIVKHIGIDTLAGISLSLTKAAALPVSMRIAIRTVYGIDQSHIKNPVTEFVNDYFSTEKVGQSLSSIPILNYIYSLDYVLHADIISDNIITESFMCDWDKYLVLDNFTVEFYE